LPRRLTGHNLAKTQEMLRNLEFAIHAAEPQEPAGTFTFLMAD
jgi:hypothetical protein